MHWLRDVTQFGDTGSPDVNMVTSPWAMTSGKLYPENLLVSGSRVRFQQVIMAYSEFLSLELGNLAVFPTPCT